MQLVIAEKPSVARDLARVLGVRACDEHALIGTDCVITWCIGHLVELDEPAAYDPGWAAWRLEALPMLPTAFQLRPARHAAGHLRAVAALIRDRRFSTIVNACDAGREGELIFRYVYQFARGRTPVQRLWISSLTDDAIRNGLISLRPAAQLDALGDAARSRSEADWLVGMNATRAVTVRNRGAGHTALYSIGRVQTPTLAMLVAREQAIRGFVPRDYWEVTATLTAAGDHPFAAQWRDDRGGRAATRLARADLADAIVARDAVHGVAVVERVRARTVREPPPLLFDLTSLQRTANRRYGLTASRTLALAQALYERHKVLTYPRTDSRHLTRDVAAELPARFAALAAQPAFAAFASPLVATPPALAGRRMIDDAKVHDHHAIIPTGAAPRALDRDEQRIFDLVVRRFLGAFYPDAEFAITDVGLRVGRAPSPLDTTAPPPDVAAREHAALVTALPPEPDRYVARGRVRVSAGWQAVAGIAAAEAPRDALADLPALAVGQILPATFAAVAKQTAPPSRYTEATLLGAMESAGHPRAAASDDQRSGGIDDDEARAAMRDCGLGTPATRAAVIETLLKRDYLRRERQHLVPTPTGIGLIDALPVASLASPELTGQWEARLARIARGDDTRAAFMADIAAYVTDIVRAIRGAPAAPPPAGQPSPAPFPRTAPARRPARARGAARGPARSITPHPAAGRSSSRPLLAAPALACPRCRDGAVIAGTRGWGCSRWRSGCRFVVWFETAGRRVTATQLRDLVTRGKTRKARFVSDRGTAIAGRLVLDAAGPARLEPSG